MMHGPIVQFVYSSITRTLFSWITGMVFCFPSALNAQAWLNIACSHDSSRIVLDGKFLGRTPLSGIPIEPGSHHVCVTPPVASSWSVRDWACQFDAASGDTIQFFVTLQKYQYSVPEIQFHWDNASESSMAKISYKSNQGLADKRSIYSEKWFQFGVISLVSGITGYVLKDRADEAYEQYRKADSIDKMNHDYARAVRYDKWSSALYIVCEVNLGVALYLGIRNVQ